MSKLTEREKALRLKKRVDIATDIGAGILAIGITLLGLTYIVALGTLFWTQGVGFVPIAVVTLIVLLVIRHYLEKKADKVLSKGGVNETEESL